MSSLAAYMAIPDPSIALARLATAARDVADSALPSEAEREVVRLFDEYRSPLLRYALSIGLRVQDGEEVIQEVFLALLRHLTLGRSRSNLRGWLFRVAHNLALKKRHVNHRRPDGVELDDEISARQIDPQPNPEQQLSVHRKQARLLAVLRDLPERDQYCLHLRAEGLRYREIAGVLGISLGAVSLALMRSIARLERVDEE